MVNDLNFSPVGSLSVAGSQDGNVSIYKRASGHLVAGFKASGPIVDADFDGPETIVVRSTGGNSVFHLKQPS
jgi:hypothetical protein